MGGSGRPDLHRSRGRGRWRARRGVIRGRTEHRRADSGCRPDPGASHGGHTSRPLDRGAGPPPGHRGLRRPSRDCAPPRPRGARYPSPDHGDRELRGPLATPDRAVSPGGAGDGHPFGYRPQDAPSRSADSIRRGRELPLLRDAARLPPALRLFLPQQSHLPHPDGADLHGDLRELPASAPASRLPLGGPGPPRDLSLRSRLLWEIDRPAGDGPDGGLRAPDPLLHERSWLFARGPVFSRPPADRTQDLDRRDGGLVAPIRGRDDHRVLHDPGHALRLLDRPRLDPGRDCEKEAREEVVDRGAAYGDRYSRRRCRKPAPVCPSAGGLGAPARLRPSRRRDPARTRRISRRAARISGDGRRPMDGRASLGRAGGPGDRARRLPGRAPPVDSTPIRTPGRHAGDPGDPGRPARASAGACLDLPGTALRRRGFGRADSPAPTGERRVEEGGSKHRPRGGGRCRGRPRMERRSLGRGRPLAGDGHLHGGRAGGRPPRRRAQAGGPDPGDGAVHRAAPVSSRGGRSHGTLARRPSESHEAPPGGRRRKRGPDVAQGARPTRSSPDAASTCAKTETVRTDDPVRGSGRTFRVRRRPRWNPPGGRRAPGGCPAPEPSGDTGIPGGPAGLPGGWFRPWPGPRSPGSATSGSRRTGRRS